MVCLSPGRQWINGLLGTIVVVLVSFSLCIWGMGQSAAVRAGCKYTKC